MRLAPFAVTIAVAMFAPRAHAEEIATFPVAFHVLAEEGTPAQDGAWIDAQLRRAEQLFAPHGVHFVRAMRRNVGGKGDMVTRADRDALARWIVPGAINVMVVASLKDVDEKDRYRFGVHWRPAATPQRRFVILSAAAPVSVLAHELGHFFGNGHSPTPNNVMSYTRTSDEIFFDDAQIKTIRGAARSILRTKEVLPLPTR